MNKTLIYCLLFGIFCFFGGWQYGKTQSDKQIAELLSSLLKCRLSIREIIVEHGKRNKNVPIGEMDDHWSLEFPISPYYNPESCDQFRSEVFYNQENSKIARLYSKGACPGSE